MMRRRLSKKSLPSNNQQQEPLDDSDDDAANEARAAELRAQRKAAHQKVTQKVAQGKESLVSGMQTLKGFGVSVKSAAFDVSKATMNNISTSWGETKRTPIQEEDEGVDVDVDAGAGDDNVD